MSELINEESKFNSNPDARIRAEQAIVGFRKVLNQSFESFFLGTIMLRSFLEFKYQRFITDSIIPETRKNNVDIRSMILHELFKDFF